MFENNRMRWAVKGFLVAWVISILLGLGLTVGLIWVVVHFVSKFW
jgi:hypothetical protein